LVLEPRGFNEATKRITDQMKSFNAEVRNKMFVAVNKWDTLQARDLAKAPLESLYQNDIKKRMIGWGLRPERAYITCALLEELRLRLQQGRLTETERTMLAKSENEARDNMARLDPTIADDLLAQLRRVYRDGGVATLRDEMSSFLKDDIARERLR